MADQFKACSVYGCKGNAQGGKGGSGGLCGMHYKRLKKNGDPLIKGNSLGDASFFYENSVLAYDGDDCLTWPYSRTSNGYGIMRRNNKKVIVSRCLCEDIHGPPPTPEHQAAHSCGNGHLACVTKGHLSWKTPAENAIDRINHGTHNRGSRNSSSKVTEDQAREIANLKGEMSQKEIADRYGVSRTAVYMIHAGKNWAWINE